MAYVADAHAWIFYLLEKLPANANKAFEAVESGDDVMFIPTIVLAECLYVIESGKISLSVEDLFSKLRISNNFIPVSLNLDVVEELPKIKIGEMHDRIIVATARLLNSKVITKDSEIKNSGIIETVW